MHFQIYVPVYRSKKFSPIRRRLVDALEFGLGHRAEVQLAAGSPRVMVDLKDSNSERLLSVAENYCRLAAEKHWCPDHYVGEIVHCLWNILDEYAAPPR